MPELPEVETVVRDLRPHLVGRRIVQLRVSKLSLRRRWEKGWRSRLLGRVVAGIERRGKWIAMDLEGPWLLIHLGMTGQLTVVPRGQRRDSHTHFIFKLGGTPSPLRLSPAAGERGNEGEWELRFRDVRRFGSVTLLGERTELDHFFEASGLGPEPWELDKALWRERLQSTRRSIKAVLLDQTVVAGVGNIYADESLFEARLHPSQLAGDLTAGQTERLRQAIVTILDRAIKLRGSTIRDYIGGSGLKGGFQREFRVYGQDGEPCPRCTTPIEVMRLAGRSTHFCPKCQKAR